MGESAGEQGPPRGPVYRSLVIERFGWWVRLYLGGTSKPDRSRWWRSDLSRGAYIRMRGEQVLGIQWRRAEHSKASR